MMDIKSKLAGPAGEKIRKKTFNLFFSVMRLAFLLIVGYIVLYPLIYMISASIETLADTLDVSHAWIPMEATWENFFTAFDTMDFWASLRNTLLLQMLSAIFEIFVCAFIAYGFARFKFKGKGIASFLLILSLLVPLEMYSLGLAVNYRILGIFNTAFAYWLPALFGVGIRSGMIIYIYQQFFIGLPGELEDAAYVDGAGPIRTYFQIALPSSSVVIVTITVLSVIWHWNECYLAELCFMEGSRPLSVIMSTYDVLLNINAGIAYYHPLYSAAMSAGCLLYMLVPLVFYMVVQRKFVKSIDRVGITG